MESIWLIWLVTIVLAILLPAIIGAYFMGNQHRNGTVQTVTEPTVQSDFDLPEKPSYTNNRPTENNIEVKDLNGPDPPEKPSCNEIPTGNNIKVKWSTPPCEKGQPIYHVVHYKAENEDDWKQMQVPAGQVEAEIDQLEFNTRYYFKVTAQYQFGPGPESAVACINTAPLPLAIQICQDKANLKQNQNDQNLPSIPQDDTMKRGTTTSLSRSQSHVKKIVRLRTKKIIKDKTKLIAKKEFGIPHATPKPMKVVMVMGATGAGKSTLINGMVNYILGVKFEDELRFKLICDDGKPQVDSVTSIITAYTFHWQEGFTVPYSLTIIDTPGFGDTRGIERDKKIVDQVKELFFVKGNNGIDTIHAIGFVAQASLVRLTHTQRYVFDSILAIFGHDIKRNIFVMATFADGATPPVIDAIEKANVPFAEAFPFNNSALYESSKGRFTEMFWQMGCESFHDFFAHLDRANPVSLQLTCEVLKEREQLEAILNSLQPKIQEGLLTINKLQKIENELKGAESQIQANKGFKKSIKVPKIKKIDLARGTYVTNCRICNRTCHPSCGIPNDENKYNCAVMDNGGYDNAKCTVCLKKCSWREHVNNSFKFETYEEVEIVTLNDLLIQYNIAVEDKNKTQLIITKLHEDLARKSQEVYEDIKRARNCIERLSQIALRPNPMSEVEYIDLLIKSEEEERKVGYEDRVKSYKNMRKQAEMMAKMDDKEIDKEFKNPNSKAFQLW